jgi:hypothetical protein
VGRLLSVGGQRLLQRTIEVEGKVYTDPEEVKKVLAAKREPKDPTTYLTYATRDQPDGAIDQALAEFNARNEVFDRLWALVERIQDYVPPAATSSASAASSPPVSDNPLTKLGFDWLFVHFLFPAAHHEEGPVRKETIDFISFAQSEAHFSGWRMLTVYYHVLDYLTKHGVGNAELQRRLQSEVGRGAGEDTSAGPSVLSFHYGGHHAYARVGYVSDSRRYRLEYFDRQRQTLELRGRTVPGYTLEAGGRPMWFEFDAPASPSRCSTPAP